MSERFCLHMKDGKKAFVCIDMSIKELSEPELVIYNILWDAAEGGGPVDFISPYDEDSHIKADSVEWELNGVIM